MPFHLDPCAFWNGPRERPVTVRDGLPALLADATGALRAPRTGYDGAGAVRSRWSSSRAITLRGADQHAVYGGYGGPCADEAVHACPATGRLSARDLACPAPSGR
ncbi:alpha/beta hydrolase [Streptomyces sp. NPDC003877]